MFQKTLPFFFILCIFVCLKGTSQATTIKVDELTVINPSNIENIRQISRIGNGGTGKPVWSGDGRVLGVNNALGFWFHDSNDLSSAPELLVEITQESHMELNHDGSRLLIWNSDNVEYWDTVSRTCLEICSLQFRRIHNVLINEDGTRLLIVRNNGSSWDTHQKLVLLYDTVNMLELLRLEFGMGYSQLELSADGLSFILGTWDETQIISLETGEVLTSYDWHSETLSHGFMPINPYNLSEGFSFDTMSLINLPSGEVLQDFPVPANAQVSGHPFMSEGFISFYYDNNNEKHRIIWDAQTGELLGNFLSNQSGSIQGRWLLVQEQDLLHVYNLQTGELALSIEHVGHAVLHPDGLNLAVTSGGKLSLWNLQTASEMDSSEDFYFSTGDLVAVRDNLLVSKLQNTLFLWDALSGELLAEWIAQATNEWQFSADGTQLIGLGYSQILFLNITTGEIRSIDTLQYDSINDFALTTDGEYLITATGRFQYCPDTGTPEPCPMPDSSVRIWDVNTGEQVSLIEIDESGYGIYSSVALSPDGHWLLVGKLGEVILYDFSNFPETALTIQNRIEAFDAVTDVTFSPDGSQIVLGYGTSYYNDAFATTRLFSVSVWLTEDILQAPDWNSAMPISELLGGGVQEIHYDNSGAFLFLGMREFSWLWPIQGASSEILLGNDFIFDNRILIVSSGNGSLELWAIPTNQP